MIKNETFTPTIANTRNEMISAIENQDYVIYVCGDAYTEILSEIKNQIKNAKSSKKAGKTCLIAAPIILYIGIMTGGIGFTIAGSLLATLFAALGIGGLADVEELLKTYYLSRDKKDGNERFVLVKKDYSSAYHCLSDGDIISFNKYCPKCGKHYKKSTMHCQICNAHIIKVSNYKDFK